MPKTTRKHRYLVTDVWGSMKGRVEVGEYVIDRWTGSPGVWNIANLKNGDMTGGFTGTWLGRHEELPPLLKQGQDENPVDAP